MSAHVWTEVTPIGDLLVRAASRHPDRDAVVFPDDRYTYAEVLRRAMLVARGLLSLGVRPRDHVGILCTNGIEFIEGLFGVALAGAVAAPINARYKVNELKYIASNADLVAILTTGDADAYVDFPDVFVQAFPELSSSEALGLDLESAPRLRNVILLSGSERPGFISRERLLELAARVSEEDVHVARSRVRLRDIGLLLYTSGTTANPKGCLLSHEAVTRGPVERATIRFGLKVADVTWGAGPLFHIGSLSPFLGSIGAAGTYVTDAFFDAGRALDLLIREKPTVMFPWFPAIMQALMNHEKWDPAKLSSVRSILLIGPRPLLDKVQAALPQVELVASCGMTETAGIYAVSDVSETVEQRATGHGRPCSGIEARIVSLSDGSEVTDSTPGEILLRGYCVMEGYYRDPANTRKALDAEGWLHTGDLYSRTPDGRLMFHDRIKDMLKVGGENVAPAEIETFLCTHPSVVMASVVGIADARLDEVPVAFVELAAGNTLEAEFLISFCRGQLASFKIPRRIHFVDTGTWPMSTTKIDKRQLRERAAKMHVEHISSERGLT
ncbi:AMP-binding enzyme family protein [Paraburkholderia xenovorans LB400]|uniref:AMP-dependent synthetase and ligase n=1 Tax=Paraburkholderia xenovorans (strain LB400) TaxID=266265 RepID=Q13I55_PARXL|nr:class I adenylate-forming enzyme family protein [Paraburkholderia xenovorans]ABE36234.1 Putative AMP-dependent synthetase and ligase [Paraburkholderia xenovorans LB400]AIP34424.1 AMP-binding enzyme family protein [Paraburkholderia xenovorans LB400]